MGLHHRYSQERPAPARCFLTQSRGQQRPSAHPLAQRRAPRQRTKLAEHGHAAQRPGHRGVARLPGLGSKISQKTVTAEAIEGTPTVAKGGPGMAIKPIQQATGGGGPALLQGGAVIHQVGHQHDAPGRLLCGPATALEAAGQKGAEGAMLPAPTALAKQ